MNEGPIIIVEDDIEDREIYAEAITENNITNEIKFFSDPVMALEYLYDTNEHPFLIISDINMPRMNGIEFKEEIQGDSYLRTKAVPFIFISTNVSHEAVKQAHLLSVQGFFKKPSRYREIRALFKAIFEYWVLCRHINN